jgi:hypothetical protein
MASDSYMYEGNCVPLTVDEGAFTANVRDLQGGAFATESVDGMAVKLIGDFKVAKAGSGDVVIGHVDGTPLGKAERNGRVVNVKLFGERVDEFEIEVGSAEFTASERLVFVGSAGASGRGTWQKDASPFGALGPVTLSGNGETLTITGSAALMPSRIVALQGSGTIASGSKVYALVGAYF